MKNKTPKYFKKALYSITISVVALLIYLGFVFHFRIQDMVYTSYHTSGTQLPVGEQVSVVVTRSFQNWLLVRGINIWFVHILFGTLLIIFNLSWVFHNKRKTKGGME